MYSRDTDSFGIPGAPELYAYTRGYFFAKNKRHLADILEIAGHISAGTAHERKLLVLTTTLRPAVLC